MLPLGILMFLASLMGLLDNEFKYIFFENAIAYADTHVVEADCNADPELVGQLVYMSCPVTGLPSLKDSLGGSGLTSLLAGETKGTDLLWETEILQYEEHEYTEKDQSTCNYNGENYNGENCTVYSYSRVWSPHTINSTSFHYKNNVGALPSNLAQKQHVVAAEGTVLVGEGYYLSESLRQQVTREAPGPIFGDGRTGPAFPAAKIGPGQYSARREYSVGAKGLSADELYVMEKGRRVQTFPPVDVGHDQIVNNAVVSLSNAVLHFEKLLTINV